MLSHIPFAFCIGFTMKYKRVLSARNVVIAIILAVMTLFVAFSDVYLDSIKNGLNLYVTAVLPSMLPFFFFSKLLTELNFASDAGKLTAKPLRALYSAPPIAGYILMMSMLCGYPVGAKLISECYDSSLLSKEDCKKITAFTSTSGPLFIVGTVGVTMFRDKTCGFTLLLCHYLGTLLNGLLYRGKRSSSPDLPLPTTSSPEDVLNKTMLNTFLSVGLVGGYITIFNLFADVAFQTGLIPLLCDGLEYLGVNRRITSGVAGGLVDMPRGCLLLSSSGFPLRLTLPLCELLLTFGGLGVTFQSLTFLAKTKISPAYYLLTKVTQGMLSSLLCFIVTLFLY